MKHNAVLNLAVAAICLSGSLGAGVSTEPAKPVSEQKLKWWMPRHESVRSRAAKGGYPVVFIGDSITHRWEKAGKEVWEKEFAGMRVLDLGFGGDTTQNLIFCIRHGGMLDGYSARLGDARAVLRVLPQTA